MNARSASATSGKRLLRLWALAAALSLVLAACGGDGTTDTSASATTPSTSAETSPDTTPETTPDTSTDTTGGETSEPSGDPIVIGGTLGLTGIYSGPSAGYEVTYNYWADGVNANGGLLGRPVELIIYDDESNPTVAQQLYQRLINEDGVDLLFAPYTTAVGGAIVPITERAEKLVVNAGFVGKEIMAQSELVVSSWPNQDNEFPRPFFEYIKTLPDGERPTTLAVLTTQNPFTIAARDGVNGEGGVLAYAEEAGLEVVLNEEYDQSATDLSSLIERVQQSGAEALVALSLPNDGALIATTVNQVGYNPMMYCQCGSQVTLLPNWPDLGEAGVNVFSTATAWPTQDFTGLAELNEFVLSELGVDVMPAYAPVALGAGQIIQQAVEATQSLDSRELRQYIGENTFDTAAGEISFNPDGTAAWRPVPLLQFTEDGNVVVWPDDYATGEAVVPLRP